MPDQYAAKGAYHWDAYKRIPAYKQHVDHILDIFKGRSGSLLDVGCGDGLISHKLARVGLGVVGVDNNELGCRDGTNCIGCGGASQYCSSVLQCRDTNCATGADCAGGDCSISLTQPFSGECKYITLCSDTEFHTSVVLANYCLIRKACTGDQDCQHPYTCQTFPIASSMKLCGRRL